MSTGTIATAIVLIIGSIIVSRIVGLAFRFIVPLVLLVMLSGAGVFSNLLSERSPADLDASYRQTQDRSGADLGDIRLRDIADIAVDAFRSVLQGGLALLDGLPEPEPRHELRRTDERHIRRGEPYEALHVLPYDTRQEETRRGW